MPQASFWNHQNKFSFNFPASCASSVFLKPSKQIPFQFLVLRFRLISETTKTNSLSISQRLASQPSFRNQENKFCFNLSMSYASIVCIKLQKQIVLRFLNVLRLERPSETIKTIYVRLKLFLGNWGKGGNMATWPWVTPWGRVLSVHACLWWRIHFLWLTTIQMIIDLILGMVSLRQDIRTRCIC
jgi:hypothetical protein